MRAAAPALEAHGLTVRYGGIAALSQVDLTVYPGEVVAIIGPNGAGKSTLLNAISGHAGQVQGQIRFAGHRLRASRSQKGLAIACTLLVGLLAAVLSANVDALWRVSVVDNFRLHCVGHDTRGCQVPWGDMAQAAWGHFAGGPVMACVAEDAASCPEVGLWQGGTLLAKFADRAAAVAARPAVWRARRTGVVWVLLGRAGVALVAAAAAAWVLGRALRAEAHAATRVARAGVARTFQNLRLFGEMTVRQNVAVALRPAQPGAGAAAGPATPGRLRDLPLEELLAALQLTELAHLPARDLAYGQLRRLEMARALALRPHLLLLDEPVAGMNARETQDVLHLLARLRAENLAILLIEHDMPMVMGISDRVVVLENGRKIAEGRPAEVRRDAAVIRAYLGTSSSQAASQAARAAATQADDDHA